MSKISYDDYILKMAGLRLKEIREEYNFSIMEMAKAACISQDNYRRVEAGKRNFSIGLICNIASGLDILPSDIFNQRFVDMLHEYQDCLLIDEIVTSKKYYRMINKKKIIKMIKKYRKQNGISQEEAAIDLSVERVYLNNFEYGRGKITATLLIGLKNILNMEINDFLREIDVRL